MAKGFAPDDNNNNKKNKSQQGNQENKNVLHLILRVVPSDEVVEESHVEQQPIASSQQLPIEQERPNERQEITASDVDATAIDAVVTAIGASDVGVTTIGASDVDATASDAGATTIGASDVEATAIDAREVGATNEQQLIVFEDALLREEILETEFEIVLSSPAISVMSSAGRGDEERDKDIKDWPPRP